MKPIAVITPELQIFKEFTGAIDDYGTDLEFVHICKMEDLRGRWFGGYISLYNAGNIGEYDELIEQLQKRLR